MRKIFAASKYSTGVTSNQQFGRTVGVDEYVSKFKPQKLAQTLERLLTGTKVTQPATKRVQG